MRAAAIIAFACVAGCPAPECEDCVLVLDGDIANQAPVFVSLDLDREALPGVPITMTATAEDPDGDEVALSWEAAVGAIESSGLAVLYTAPGEVSWDAVLVTADDGHSNTTTETVFITIGQPTLFSEPMAVASTSGNSKTPDVAVTADGTVHVVWHDFTDDPAALYHATLKDGAFVTTRLGLSPDKSLFPRLVPGGDDLHVLWQIWRDDEYLLCHARYSGGSWGEASEIGKGEQVGAALDASGRLHALFFRQDRPVHAIREDDIWMDGDEISLEHDYVSTFRLGAVGTATGIELALATSPGGTGYDIRIFRWTESGWSAMETLYSSIGYSSDEPEGAVDGDLVPHWVWTEQMVEDVWTVGIVEMTAEETAPRWVTQESGFSASPSIVYPADDIPIVAWETPGYQIALARYPYSERIEIGGAYAHRPRMAVDDEGFTHLVFYGTDADDIQQIFYSTNRP